MNFSGLLLGAGAFLCIGLFHPLVIKAEYYFGVRSWWAFLIVGLLAAFFWFRRRYRLTDERVAEIAAQVRARREGKA